MIQFSVDLCCKYLPKQGLGSVYKYAYEMKAQRWKLTPLSNKISLWITETKDIEALKVLLSFFLSFTGWCFSDVWRGKWDWAGEGEMWESNRRKRHIRWFSQNNFALCYFHSQQTISHWWGTAHIGANHRGIFLDIATRPKNKTHAGDLKKYVFLLNKCWCLIFLLTFIHF